MKLISLDSFRQLRYIAGSQPRLVFFWEYSNAKIMDEKGYATIEKIVS